MRAGLVALLAAEGSITTYTSSRIYINKAPQGAALPHIIITQLDSEEHKTFDTTSSLRTITFDIDCVSDRSVEAEDVADAVRVYLDDFTGTAGSFTIAAVLYQSESDDYIPPQDASDNGKHITTLTFDVQYNP